MEPANWANLLPAWEVERLVKSWLTEDVPSTDIGGFVVGSGECTAKLWMKQSGVVCGRPFFDAVFAEVSCWA